MPPQRNISLIAWDLDNTLIDRDAAFRAFFESWLASRLPDGNGSALMASIWVADRSGTRDRLEFCAEVLELCGFPRFGAVGLWEEMQHELPRRMTLDSRVARLLDALAPVYRMVIVTNGGGALQRAKIRHAGLARWFPPEAIFVSGEIGAPKPERAFFDAVLSATGASAAEVLIVGDHLENDIRGAAACGWQTCWVSLGRPWPKDLPVEDGVVRVWELEGRLSPPAVSLKS